MRVRARWCGGPFVLLAWLLAPPAPARPYEVDDMLRLQSYGQVAIDPGERWAVVARRAPYTAADDYSLGPMVRRRLSRLFVVDLARPAAPAPLIAAEAGAGDWLGGFSPSGRRLSVLRLQGDAVRLGIVEMATRRVRWLDVRPALPIASPAPVWRDDDTLLVVARTRAGLPAYLAQLRAPAEAAALAARTARGTQAAVTRLGSGRDLQAGATAGDDVLLLVDAVTGRARPLISGDIEDAALSASGRTAAVVIGGDAVQPTAAVRLDPSFQTKTRALWLVDLATGQRRAACRRGDVLPYLLSWAPTRDALLYFDRAPGGEWGSGQLWTISADGRCRTVLPAGWRPRLERLQENILHLPAAWDGGDPLVRAAPTGGGRAEWLRLGARGARVLTASLPSVPTMPVRVGRGRVDFVGDGRLWRADGGRAARPIAGVAGTAGLATLDPHAEGVRPMLAPPAAVVPLLVRDTRGTHLRLVGDTLDASAALPSPGEPAAVLAIAPRRGAALALATAPTGASTLWLLRAAHPPLALERLNRHLDAVDLPERRAVVARAADGTTLVHWLSLPRGRPRPPLVVLPYPGQVFTAAPPALNAGEVRPAVNENLLVGHGYAVLRPSLPLAYDEREPLEPIVSRVLAATDAAIATGAVDPERVAVYGHSYGGYAALAVASRTRRFRAVVAAAAAANLVSAYGSLAAIRPSVAARDLRVQPMAWSEGGQGRMGEPPWRAPERYRRNSPIAGVGAIETPVLLIHGTNDAVPVAEAEQLWMSLYRQGRDAQLLRYWGEGHDLASPANIRDMWTRLLDWLDAALARPVHPSDQARVQASRLAATSSER